MGFKPGIRKIDHRQATRSQARLQHGIYYCQNITGQGICGTRNLWEKPLLLSFGR